VVRVKICGITSTDDALWAIDCGADAIGFIFAPSRRRISPGTAQKIRGKLPPFVSVVGVFVEPDPRSISTAFDMCALDYIQYYGNHEAQLLQDLQLPACRLIRSISVETWADLEEITRSAAGIIHLDTKVKGKTGGTGQTFDWKLAAMAKKYGRPIVLSGGLTPENVESAIAAASPDAVDVSSGVEASPGKKDRKKVREFIRRAKHEGS